MISERLQAELVRARRRTWRPYLAYVLAGAGWTAIVLACSWALAVAVGR